MIRIESKKTWRDSGVYIGKASLFGNSFHLGTHGTRNKVIAQYRVWQWPQIKLQTPVFQELQ